MNKTLPYLLALASCAASAADAPATLPAPAASAPAADCTRERITTHVVNGKTVEVRRREPVPGCKPQAVRLWD